MNNGRRQKGEQRGLILRAREERRRPTRGRRTSRCTFSASTKAHSERSLIGLRSRRLFHAGNDDKQKMSERLPVKRQGVGLSKLDRIVDKKTRLFHRRRREHG